jgi:hypothetical protein
MVGKKELHLDVQDHARPELGAEGNLLLANLQQLRSLRPPLQAPVLCQPCHSHS